MFACPLVEACFISASQRLQVAKHDSISTDIEGRDPQGALLYRQRMYIITTRDGIVLIQVLAAADQVDRDFPAIEQAISALG